MVSTIKCDVFQGIEIIQSSCITVTLGDWVLEVIKYNNKINN